MSARVQRRHTLSGLGINRLIRLADKENVTIPSNSTSEVIIDTIIAAEERNEWFDAFQYHAIYSTDSHPEEPLPQHLPIQLLTRVVRALGQTPNPEELQTIEKLSDPDAVGYFAFPELCKAMEYLKTRVHDSQDLVAAFETMAEGGEPGMIHFDVMREKMKRAGLDKQELEQMVRDGAPDASGFVDYNKFIERMLAVRNQSSHRKHTNQDTPKVTVDEIRDLLQKPRTDADNTVYTIEDRIKYRYKYKTTEEIVAELRSVE